MTIYKYNKMYPQSLSGHVDTLRTLMRIFRRAKADVTYSKGYNPHMEIFCSPALGLGTESLCEYVAVKGAPCDIDILNSVSAPGIKFVASFTTDDVNIAALVTSAVYAVHCAGIAEKQQMFWAKPFNIVQSSKEGDKIKDVSSKIFGVEVVDKNDILIKVACGNDNLRPDKLLQTLNSDDYGIVKQQMFIGELTVDEYLSQRTM